MNGGTAVGLLACWFLTLDGQGFTEQMSLRGKPSVRVLWSMLPQSRADQRARGGLPSSQLQPIVPVGTGVPCDSSRLVPRDLLLSEPFPSLTPYSGNVQLPAISPWGPAPFPDFWNAAVPTGRCQGITTP